MSDPRPVMVITGGSRGIGAATARLAAKTGYDLAIGYRSEVDAAASVAADCRVLGADVDVLRVDLADERSIIGFFDAAVDHYGRIDSFINNAGTLRAASAVVDIELARLEEVFRINAIGPIVAGREAVRRMSIDRGGDGGTIVNVSSAASYLGSPNEYVDYAATKGALDTFTIGLAKEVATQGIRVNAVRPGLIYTDIHELSGIENRVDKLSVNVPMRRGGDADEVAEAILWLASPASSYVTGTFIDVTGGR